MKMDDNNLQTQSISLLDPLEILSAKVKGIGFQSMMVICPNLTMGVKYFLRFDDGYTGKKMQFSFKLDGGESMQALCDPDVQAKWRQKVISEATACIIKASR
jgi:hypothetical protein